MMIKFVLGVLSGAILGLMCALFEQRKECRELKKEWNLLQKECENLITRCEQLRKENEKLQNAINGDSSNSSDIRNIKFYGRNGE
jgi:gas vesicle protein